MMKIGVYTKNFEGVWFGVACDEEQVFATAFGRDEKAALKSLLDCVPYDVEFQVFSAPSPFAEKVLNSVKSVYDGKDASESFPLASERLTAFNKRVLEVTRLIPVGYVASYGSLSEAAGGSARAVGGVMAANPFAPIVPCHRVVRSDFTLGGYGGGLDVKAEMLAREKRGKSSPVDVPTAGKKLRIFPVELALEKVEKGK
jgi:methylated-DNA-[protein]-cysteine S-methyltransferase